MHPYAAAPLPPVEFTWTSSVEIPDAAELRDRLHKIACQQAEEYHCAREWACAASLCERVCDQADEITQLRQTLRILKRENNL